MYFSSILCHIATTGYGAPISAMKGLFLGAVFDDCHGVFAAWCFLLFGFIFFNNGCVCPRVVRATDCSLVKVSNAMAVVFLPPTAGLLFQAVCCSFVFSFAISCTVLRIALIAFSSSAWIVLMYGRSTLRLSKLSSSVSASVSQVSRSSRCCTSVALMRFSFFLYRVLLIVGLIWRHCVHFLVVSWRSCQRILLFFGLRLFCVFFGV